jgi:hypothetical protein
VLLAELHSDIAEVSGRIKKLKKRITSLITACGSTLTG